MCVCINAFMNVCVHQSIHECVCTSSILTEGRPAPLSQHKQRQSAGNAGATACSSRCLRHPICPSRPCLSVRMCVCVRVCMCVCMYVCMYACMHACMHACPTNSDPPLQHSHESSQAHTPTRAHACMCAHAQTPARTRALTRPCILQGSCLRQRASLH